MNRLGIYQQFRINSDFGARPKKKIQVQNTTWQCRRRTLASHRHPRTRKARNALGKMMHLMQLPKRRIEERTKERDEAMAKAEALEKRIKELEAEGKVIHLLFSN
jgi:seryl-tRNA synthetase